MSFVIWALISVVSFILEMGTLSLFFLFSGIGSIFVIVFMAFNIVSSSNIFSQLLVFFIVTIISFIVLIKPLRNLLKKSKSDKQYSDVVGTHGFVGVNDLMPDSIGEVIWSGATMQAKLDSSVKESIASGEKVIVIAVDGNILIVKK